MKTFACLPSVLFIGLYIGLSGMAHAAEMENAVLKVVLDENQQTLQVLDKRTHRVWEQRLKLPDEKESAKCLYTASTPSTGSAAPEGWTAVQPVAIGQAKTFNQGTVESQTSGIAWFMYDNQNIYIRVKVDDKTISPVSDDAVDFAACDGLKVWLGNTSVYCVITSPAGPADANPCLKAHRSENAKKEPIIETYLHSDSSGYTAMLVIPLAISDELCGAVEKNSALPLAIAFNDAGQSGTSPQQRSFPEKFTQDNADSYATLKFLGNGGPNNSASSIEPVLELASCDTNARTMTFNAKLPGLQKSGKKARAPFRVEYALHSTKPDLKVTFEPHTEGEWHEVAYPYSFYMPEQDAYLVFPHSEGLLAPLHKNAPDYLPLNKDYIYSGYGPYCACLGMASPAVGDGLLILYNDPELGGYDMVDVPTEAGLVTVPQVFWRANKYQFDRGRSVTFCFQDTGGYVAMAKRYQEFCKENGYFRTLEDKAKELPVVNQMIGAPVIWMQDHGDPHRIAEMAGAMKGDGIDKALIEVGHAHYSRTPGLEKEASDMEGVIKQVRDMGYVVSKYDQYRECAKKNESSPFWEQLNIDAYPDACLRQENGEIRQGWPPLYLMNLECGLELAKKHIPADLTRYAYNGRFIDCIGTCVIWEGEDWDPKHPLDTYGAKQARLDILKYVNSQGLTAGTEGSVDYVLPYLHWLETPMSLVKWTAIGLSVPGTDVRPDFPEYQNSISTKYRIPFYSLVHHSEVINTWRYEDSQNRLPQYWQDKNLWNVLYGTPPLFFIDQATYAKYRKAIYQTFRYVCDWAKKVGYAEMISHRFISGDRMVQETQFSTGDGVVVNFSHAPYTLSDGQILSARSYLTFNAANPRIYAPPPVAEMNYEQLNEDNS